MTKKKKRTRRSFTDAQKAKMVSEALKTSSTAVAMKHKLSSGTVSRWVRDPRYGGVNTLTQSVDRLPTVRRQVRRKRALVATGYACPHCGGPIVKED